MRCCAVRTTSRVRVPSLPLTSRRKTTQKRPYTRLCDRSPKEPANFRTSPTKDRDGRRMTFTNTNLRKPLFFYCEFFSNNNRFERQYNARGKNRLIQLATEDQTRKTRPNRRQDDRYLLVALASQPAIQSDLSSVAVCSLFIQFRGI